MMQSRVLPAATGHPPLPPPQEAGAVAPPAENSEEQEVEEEAQQQQQQQQQREHHRSNSERHCGEGLQQTYEQLKDRPLPARPLPARPLPTLPLPKQREQQQRLLQTSPHTRSEDDGPPQQQRDGQRPHPGNNAAHQYPAENHDRRDLDRLSLRQTPLPPLPPPPDALFDDGPHGHPGAVRRSSENFNEQPHQQHHSGPRSQGDASRVEWETQAQQNAPDQNVVHPYNQRPLDYRDSPASDNSGSERQASYASAAAPVQPQLDGPQSPVAALITPEALEEYRKNAKLSTDPQVQLEFAKFLIEAALSGPKSAPNGFNGGDSYRENLLNEGLKWIKRLASQGIGLGRTAYPEAQFFLADCYGNGSLGLPVDHEKAFTLYVQASKQSHPPATYRSAVCYELGLGTKRDHARAVQFYRKAAAFGVAGAMYKLGVILLNGLLGQQQNPREAITWLKRASAVADAENPHALHELGLCYEKAGVLNIIPDEAYSRELFTKAAQFGYPLSQYKMGHCYEHGTLTCPVDPRRSIYWYTRAADQGDPESELALSGWYLTGAENVLQQSDAEAYFWARKAADAGLAKAEYAVGYYSEVGVGVRQDLEEAKRWYARAAAQGNKKAVQRLADLKRDGEGDRRVKPEKPTRSQDGECTIS